MKDFYELISDVEQRNREQRQAYAQMLQPFFNALSAKAQRQSDLDFQRKVQDEERASYHKSASDWAKGAGIAYDNVNPNTPIELQNSILNIGIQRRMEEEKIENQLQRAGLGDKWKDLRTAYPDEDADVLYGKLMPQISAKEAEESAKRLGTKYYTAWQTRVANGEDAYSALGDVTRQSQRDDAAWSTALQHKYDYRGGGSGGGGGEGGGVTANQMLENIARTNELKSQKERYYTGVTYKYPTGEGNATANVTVKILPNAQNSTLYTEGSENTKKIVTSTKDKNLTQVQYEDKNYVMLGNAVYRTKRKKGVFVLEKAGNGLPDGVKVAMRQAKADYLNAENQYINYPSLMTEAPAQPAAQGNGNPHADKYLADL